MIFVTSPSPLMELLITKATLCCVCWTLLSLVGMCGFRIIRFKGNTILKVPKDRIQHHFKNSSSCHTELKWMWA